MSNPDRHNTSATPALGGSTGFRSAPHPGDVTTRTPAVILAYEDRRIGARFRGQADPPQWPTYDALVGANPRTWHGSAMLRYAPWFHPLAVRDEDWIHSYTDNSEMLPGDLPGVVTMS
ncbi:unnamed protein product [Agarophyton chilense]